jgi:hypothetical protein
MKARRPTKWSQVAVVAAFGLVMFGVLLMTLR